MSISLDPGPLALYTGPVTTPTKPNWTLTGKDYTLASPDGTALATSSRVPGGVALTSWTGEIRIQLTKRPSLIHLDTLAAAMGLL